MTFRKYISPQIYLSIWPAVFPNYFLVFITQFLSFVTTCNCLYNSPNIFPEFLFFLNDNHILPANFWCQFLFPNLSSQYHGKTQLYASNMDTQKFPLKPPHLTLIEIIYNQSHILKLISTPNLYQQHYPPHKYKWFTPLLDVEPPQKIPSLSTNNYISCRPPTSGNEPYPFHNVSSS